MKINGDKVTLTEDESRILCEKGAINLYDDCAENDGKADVSHFDAIIAEVKAELSRATKKFPLWPTDPLHALAVLGEEYGELNKDVLQLAYEPHKTTAENVRKEAIQTAAMALRFAMSLERYNYWQSPQHNQKDVDCDNSALYHSEK